MFSYVVAPKGINMYRRLGFLAVAVSVVTVISLSIILTRSELTNATLALIYFTSALPFLLAGIIVSLVISETIARVDKVYFFDLMGAAAGCLLLVPFLNVIGGPNTVIIASVAFAASSAIWFNLSGSSRGRMGGVALALLFVALIVLNLKKPFIDVQFAKGQRLVNETFVKWNPISRIALAPEKDSDMMLIFIDADASTGIANFDFSNLTALATERSGVTRAGVRLSDSPGRQRPSSSAPVAAGMSRERLASGSKDITGVEINPIIANTIMRKNFPQLEPKSLSAAGSPHRGGGRSEFRQAQSREVSDSPGDARRYLGINRRRSVCAIGEQPVHDRCLLRLLESPDRRRHSCLYALGLRSAS